MLALSQINLTLKRLILLLVALARTVMYVRSLRDSLPPSINPHHQLKDVGAR